MRRFLMCTHYHSSSLLKNYKKSGRTEVPPSATDVSRGWYWWSRGSAHSVRILSSTVRWGDACAYHALRAMDITARRRRRDQVDLMIAWPRTAARPPCFVVDIGSKDDPLMVALGDPRILAPIVASLLAFASSYGLYILFR